MTPTPFEVRFWRLAPQEVDPLTWFTGSFVPLLGLGLTLVYGGIQTVASWSSGSRPWLQASGLLLCLAACLLAHIATRPMLPRLGWGAAIGVVALAAAGSSVAAFGHPDAIPIEVWWGPFGFAFALVTLAPYLTPRVLVLLGSVGGAVVVAVSYVAIGDAGSWGPVGTASVLASPIVSSLAALVGLSVGVVARALPLIEMRSRALVALDGAGGDRNAQAERDRLERLTSQADPFLDGIAESGLVTRADRTLAGQLARRLRDDLVTQSDLTWLDSVAPDRLVVVDPERRADRMRSAQRTALRGLVRAILDMPGTDAGSLLIEFRAQPDGSTAVGISLDVDLPEGRRITHLVPYYLALRGSVEDLRWAGERAIAVTFALPGEVSSR